MLIWSHNRCTGSLSLYSLKWNCTKLGGLVVIFLSLQFHLFLALAESFYYWNFINITLKLKQPFVLLCLKQGSVCEVLRPKTLSKIIPNLYLRLEAEGWIQCPLKSRLCYLLKIWFGFSIKQTSYALKCFCRLSRLCFRSVIKCYELIYKSTVFPCSLFFLKPIELLIFAGSSAAVALSLSFFYYISRV